MKRGVEFSKSNLQMRCYTDVVCDFWSWHVSATTLARLQVSIPRPVFLEVQLRTAGRQAIGTNVMTEVQNISAFGMDLQNNEW